jgi:hypothetical protein
MDKAERVRELLNFTGYPLQHYCAARVSGLPGFQLSAEVPYTYPSSNGPLLGVHGVIDMIAACPDATGQRLIVFIVECKKANDKVKNWILLTNSQQHPRWPTFFFTSTAMRTVEASLDIGVTRSVTFPKLKYERTVDYDFCVNGIEANVDLGHINHNQAEKIYLPLKQVAHGTRAFEATYPKVVEGIDYFRNDQFAELIYVPVVLTTANVYVVEVPVDQVANGEIPEGGLSLADGRSWATYEFALPDYLSYEVPRGSRSLAVAKRTVFIVNDKSIDAFFANAIYLANVMDIPENIARR